jgi:hypothetical protein
MNSDSAKTALIENPEPRDPAAKPDEERKRLAEAAVESLRETERISGFGRFMLKGRSLFRETGYSASPSEGHWRTAPVLVAAGILFLMALAFLFLLSRPEGKTVRYFRAANSLTGPDDSKALPNAAYAPPPVAESQLVGEEFKVTPQGTEKDPSAKSTSGRKSLSNAFAAQGENMPEPPSVLPAGSPSTGLQAPATVFVAVPPKPDPPNAKREEAQDKVLQLPAGTEILAHTTNAISSGLDSPVVAVVDQAVNLGDVLFIPQGARAIGNTAGAVRNRVNVRFSSLVLPDGREIEFSGLALMKDGSAGLVGKVQGTGHPVLAGTGRVATGAAVLATQFAGSASLNQPFSEGDLLRNQFAAEIASQGNRLSNRLQAPLAVPIVTVPANQPIHIFLMAPIRLGSGQSEVWPAPPGNPTGPAREQGSLPPEDLLAAQAAYIKTLEAQLAELRAALAAQLSGAQR